MELHFNLDKGETEDIFIFVNGKARMSISLNYLNASLHVPGGVREGSIGSTEISFFLRTKDVE